MRRRSVRRALWGTTAGSLAVVAVFFNHSAGPPAQREFHGHAVVNLPGYSSNGTLESPSDDDIAQVEKALDTRARAVLGGDRVAFLSTVDGDRGAFTAEQGVVWRNTRQLPFERLSYRFDGLVEPDRPLPTASFLARVTTTYRLRGFDSAPIEVDDGFTFVQKDGTWKLASTTDADDQFVQKSLPTPWDNGPIAAYDDHGYLAVVDRGRRPLARRIVALCDAGSRMSDRLLGAANTRPTVVVATSRQPGFTKFSGEGAEAVTYPLAGPQGTTSGWGVVVNPQDVDQAAADPVVLPHEVTHLATQDYLAYLPAWLAEGAAEYVGWHAHGGLAGAIPERDLPPATGLPAVLPTTAGFYLHDARLNYLEGQALVGWIVEHRGPDAVLSLMKAYADAGGYDLTFDPDTATPGILRDTLGMTPGGLAQAAFAHLHAVAWPS